MDSTKSISDEIPGRKPGSHCSLCDRGKLLPVIVNHSGDNGIMGTDGRSWSHDYINRLACSHCSVCFEVAKTFRERELNGYLEKQVEGFKNPEKKPSTCVSCRQKLAQGNQTEDHPMIIGGVRICASYLYCAICFKVYWVEKPKESDDYP